MTNSFEKTLEEMKKTLKSLEKLEIERDYAVFGLNFNPFPPAAVPRYPHLGPMDPDIQEKVLYFISATYSKREDEQFGEYAGLTIVGEYGMGKTQLMNYIQYLIDCLTETEEFEFSALTTYIARPEDSPQKVIHRIVEQIGFDTLRKFMWQIIIERFEKEEKKKRGSFQEKYKPGYTTLIQHTEEAWAELFNEPARSNPLEFIRRFRHLNGDFEKLREGARTIIRTKIISNEVFANRYLDLIFPEKKAELSWDVLAGYISSRDVKRKEVDFLNSVVKILKQNEIDMLYVFIDEFEDISKLTKAKLTDYLLTLNTLINSERRWAIIVSLTPDAMDKIKAESPPLYDRLTSVYIRLEPLNEEKAKKLILNYLNLSRKEDENNLYPFSEGLIKEMGIYTKGNYRSFIRIAHKIIEVALMDGIEPPFDENILERVSWGEHESSNYTSY